ncbi:MAG TPA: hypothetical protein VEU08_13830 [Vicinamibacterales bacterium]|nr:hypothetical protein [Vicinamibacterales bacterium]
MSRRVHFLSSALAAALLVAAPALAGPPLLCFPFDIGSAKSLPMGARGWESVDPSYEPSRLVDDTLAILTPRTPVVVRMETLRRATIYAMKSPKLADALLDALEARASHPDANMGYAVFDFGYAVETYKQAGWMPGGREQAGDARHAIARAGDIDGYMLVTKARTLTGDQSMSFALVALGIDKKHGVDALRAAVAGAREAAKTSESVRLNLANHWTDTIAQF